MKVVVCTPWVAGTTCRYRLESADWTAAYWASLGVQVVHGIGESRAAARNRASLNVMADVLFFADADMWVPEQQFWAAAEEAHRTGRMVHAYVQHTRLDKQRSAAVMAGRDVGLRGQTVMGCSGGTFAVSRELLELVGGHDERFTVWGGEDRSFQFACDTLAGPGQRIPGHSYHLWHPRDPVLSRHTPERTYGMELAKRYKRAAGIKDRTGIVAPTKDAVVDREAMLAILREDGGPLATGVASVHA